MNLGYLNYDVNDQIIATATNICVNMYVWEYYLITFIENYDELEF